MILSLISSSGSVVGIPFAADAPVWELPTHIHRASHTKAFEAHREIRKRIVAQVQVLSDTKPPEARRKALQVVAVQTQTATHSEVPEGLGETL